VPEIAGLFSEASNSSESRTAAMPPRPASASPRATSTQVPGLPRPSIRVHPRPTRSAGAAHLSEASNSSENGTAAVPPRPAPGKPRVAAAELPAALRAMTHERQRSARSAITGLLSEDWSF
jgi:hypothetical protein